MTSPLSLILLVAGIALVIFGVLAAESFSSSMSKLFTGSPTDKAMWMMLGGVVLIGISGYGLYRGPRTR